MNWFQHFQKSKIQNPGGGAHIPSLDRSCTRKGKEILPLLQVFIVTWDFFAKKKKKEEDTGALSFLAWLPSNCPSNWSLALDTACIGLSLHLHITPWSSIILSFLTFKVMESLSINLLKQECFSLPLGKKNHNICTEYSQVLLIGVC